MGFPDRIIVGRTEDDNAFHGFLDVNQRGQAFQQINASNLMQLLAQLIDARRFAQEIFTELAEETVKTSQRLKAVSARVRSVAEVVPGIQRIFHETSPDCFLVPSSMKLERNTNIRGGIFIRRGAPEKVDRRRHEGADPPNLNALNKFSKALDLANLKKENPALDETNLRCGDKYSLPQFFFQQWLEQEAEKHRIRKKIRKQRRAERKAAKKAKKEEKDKHKDKKVSRVRKKYVDQFGNIFYKEIGKDINVEERSGVRRAQNVTVSSHTYGAPETNLNQNYGETTPGVAGTYELGMHQPVAEPELIRPEAQVTVPPPVVHTNPNHVHVAMPTVPAAPNRQNPHAPPVPPAVPVTHGSGGPPVPPAHTLSQPMPPKPVHVAPTPPQPPAKPAMPAHMTPYVKMKKIGLGEWQIKNKMKTNGHDPDDYDRYLGDGAPPPTTAARTGAPPPNPHANRPPPTPAQPQARPAPKFDLMASIRQGKTLQKSTAPPPKPAAPSGGPGGLMAAIRAGAKLKKAKDRAPPPPRELTGQDALMAAIRKGASGGLKSAADRKLKEKEPEPETGDIFALLRLREKIADSESEEESGSWDSD